MVFDTEREDLEKKRQELVKRLEERIRRGEFSTHTLRVGPPVEREEDEKKSSKKAGKS